MNGWPGETVTVRRQASTPSGEDSQGNPIYPTSSFTVTGCVFAPRDSGETGSTVGPRIITGGTVYAPQGTVFESTDVLTIRGDEYVVDGESGVWVAPFESVRGGVEVAVKRGG